jgi:16S rRNA (cytidine1402-2'-O)-methyltransferase
LTLVATPIGNLGDLAPRAIEALKAADVVVCEDTRQTRKLLSHAGIPAGNRLIAVHDQNEAASVRRVVDLLDSGRHVAVVTDAGTPGISDPGERLVRAAAAAGHTVDAVPGPTAAITALVVSGLPTGRFVFEGFLPRKGSERTGRLAAIADERRTVVLYESPHRVADTVDDLVEACGPLRRVALARELTKLYEEVWRGSLENAARHLDEHQPRGEFVIVLDGAPAPEAADDGDIEAELARHLANGADKKTAIATVAAELGVAKRRVYQIGITRNAP